MANRALSILAATIFLGAQACSLPLTTPTGSVLAESLTHLQPIHDRDHFVYLWQRIIDGRRAGEGIHVEHVTAGERPGEFEIAVTEDGRASEQLKLSASPDSIELIEEEDLGQGFRLTYSPPLTQLRAPVVFGEQTSASTATVTQTSDNKVVNSIEVTQVVSVSPVRTVESSLGTFHPAVAITAVRTLRTPAGAIELKSALVIAPGIGEIRSEGTAHVALQDLAENHPTPPPVIVRRELACAIIGGRAIGDCRMVDEALEKLRAR